MKINHRIIPYVTVVILSLLILKCKKDDGNGEAQLPAITSDNVTNIWQTTATGGGTVSSDGGVEVTGPMQQTAKAQFMVRRRASKRLQKRLLTLTAIHIIPKALVHRTGW